MRTAPKPWVHKRRRCWLGPRCPSAAILLRPRAHTPLTKSSVRTPARQSPKQQAACVALVSSLFSLPRLTLLVLYLTAAVSLDSVTQAWALL